LAGLDGSCQTPIAGLAELDGEKMRLRGEVIRPDGSEVLQDEITCSVTESVEMASSMAKRLRDQMGKDFF
jgi:hydroxymethylbilane synthase